MKRMGAVESDSVKSTRKAKDKLHKACERVSETREQTLHGQEQNRMHMATMRESRRQCSVSNQQRSTCCAEGLALQCLSLRLQLQNSLKSQKMCSE